MDYDWLKSIVPEELDKGNNPEEEPEGEGGACVQYLPDTVQPVTTSQGLEHLYI